MLLFVAIGITVAVYGAVALIVKADDVGVALAKNDGASATGSMSRAFGRALVLGMPGFLTFLSAAGTAAMIWVGGGIIVMICRRTACIPLARPSTPLPKQQLTRCRSPPER